jgi:hypothetical protein
MSFHRHFGLPPAKTDTRPARSLPAGPVFAVVLVAVIGCFTAIVLLF